MQPTLKHLRGIERASVLRIPLPAPGPMLAILLASFGPCWGEVTTGTLLEEMTQLEQLARWPQPAYRTIQFSSYDRRSTTAEAPGWFANADGFGGEPIPAFEKVLRPPQGNQPGLFLLAKVEGPGAIVRGWSAGMAGVLRVYLDPPADGSGQGALVWEGPAYEFLARRSAQYLKSGGLALNPGDAFSQEDADYLPIAFARGLRVTWEGKLDELHFYHLQVRLYPAATQVRTFDPKRDLQEFATQLRRAAHELVSPGSPEGVEAINLAGALEPGKPWTWSSPSKGPGAIRQLKLRLTAEPLEPALRGCLLRISFDGSQRPQVEAPLGDFFGSGPGVNPFSSLPFAVESDGSMTCRFVMPYKESVRLEILNHSGKPAELTGFIRLSPWEWDQRTMYFRAKWRADHDLLAGAGALDLPYLLVIGKGVFAGCAAMLMNPSGVPTAGGNWWGEGDEKILVDSESTPSIFGTGSEDYFNYSWSRPDLFSHPYCGQPLDSGPDTSGFISNHRFQVMDRVPFERSFALFLELWAHSRTPGLSYARIVYHYALPGAIDDHRALMPSDLRIPPLPKREPRALGGATGTRFYFPAELHPAASTGALKTEPFPLATQQQVLLWQAEKGGKLTLQLASAKTGRASIHLVAAYQPDGASIRLALDGKALPAGDAGRVALRCAHGARVLNVNTPPVDLAEGTHSLVLECVEPGAVGLDYIWVKPE